MEASEFARHYRLGPAIGNGPFSSVHRATQVPLQREVVVKFVDPARLPPAADDFRARFARDARQLARIAHPDLIGLFNFGEVDGAPFIVLPYIDGGTIDRLPETPVVLDLGRAFRLLAAAARAIDCYHAHNLAHLAVHPRNLLLTHAGYDLLLADGRLGHETALPAAVAEALPPDIAAYLAPEQCAGEPATPASDVYALGCVAFRLIAGRPPYGGTTREVLRAHLAEALPSLEQVVLGLPVGTDAVLHRALARDPAARYPAAVALVEALRPDGLVDAARPFPPLIPTAAGQGVP